MQISLKELALLFLKLGTTAFGGPAAHVAMMEEEVVRRRRWMARDDFLDLWGATNLIPGPNSTELAIHIGYRCAGFPGLIVAGLCFILPAFFIVLGIASLYVRFKTLPQMDAILYGVKPVVLAVVIQALWGLGRSAVKTRFLAALGLAVVLANVLGGNEILLLAAAGLGGVAAKALDSPRDKSVFTLLALPATGAAASAATSLNLGTLFLLFLKTGSVLFGSGYVLLAFLRADFVERLHWLTEAQLLDAVAVGQVTPGPVFTTATFIGYVLNGTSGAVAATLGIFLPAFFFVGLSYPIIPRLRQSRLASGFLDGVNVASLALMGVVSAQLGRAAIVDAPTILLAIVSAVLLIRFRVNSAWLVLAGAVSAYFMQFLF